MVTVRGPVSSPPVGAAGVTREAGVILLLQHWQPGVEGSTDDGREVWRAASGYLAMNHPLLTTHHTICDSRGGFPILAGVPRKPVVPFWSESEGWRTRRTLVEGGILQTLSLIIAATEKFGEVPITLTDENTRFGKVKSLAIKQNFNPLLTSIINSRVAYSFTNNPVL